MLIQLWIIAGTHTPKNKPLPHEGPSRKREKDRKLDVGKLNQEMEGMYSHSEIQRIT